MARRRKRRYKPRFFVICGSLICLIVSLVLIIFVGSKFEVNYETDLKLPDKAQTQMEHFIKDAYKYMGTWEEKDLTKWFAEDYEEEALVCQTSYDLLVEMRSLRENDLRFKNKGVAVTVTQVEEFEGGYNVYFEEAYKCKFNFMKETSQTQGVECTMGLVETDRGYELSYYTREEDFYSYITEGYRMGSDNPAEELLALKETVIKDFKKQLQVMKELKSNAEYEELHCDVRLDRAAAEEYALKYALTRNSDKWYVFDDLGGNCQNFGSQVIHAGGVPMDRKGDEVWKYYDIESDESKKRKGRSPSWSGVTNFYEYAKTNTGYGLCAKVDANIYTAEAGDIMQVGDGTGDYVHTIVSLGPIKDGDGNIIDINTVSNTTDRKNYPLSAYNCTYMRLIKIYGYNN